MLVKSNFLLTSFLSCSNVHSLLGRGLLHHGGLVQGTCVEVGTVRVLRLIDLCSSLERWLVYPREENTNAGTNVGTSKIIGLEMLHSLEHLLKTSYVVMVLELHLYLWKAVLSCMPLDETRTKKHELQFLECSMDVAGLAKPVDALLRVYVPNDRLQLGVDMVKLRTYLGNGDDPVPQGPLHQPCCCSGYVAQWG